jgi:hypothetical protein
LRRAGPFIGPTQKTGAALAARPLLNAHQNKWNKPTKSKNSEQNEEKFCIKSMNKEPPTAIGFLNR